MGQRELFRYKNIYQKLISSLQVGSAGIWRQQDNIIYGECPKDPCETPFVTIEFISVSCTSFGSILWSFAKHSLLRPGAINVLRFLRGREQKKSIEIVAITFDLNLKLILHILLWKIRTFVCGSHLGLSLYIRVLASVVHRSVCLLPWPFLPGCSALPVFLGFGTTKSSNVKSNSYLYNLCKTSVSV